MKSKTILPEEERVSREEIPEASVRLWKYHNALQIAEAEIEEKDKRIKELEDLGDEAFHEERYIDALGTIQNKNAQIVSKDKEIVSLINKGKESEELLDQMTEDRDYWQTYYKMHTEERDKEIAELKEINKDFSRALGVAGTLNEEKNAEISALKEEIEELKKEKNQMATMYRKS